MAQTVTSAEVGTVISTDGLLASVKLTKVPASEGYGENVTLSDMFEGVDDELVHFSPSTQPVTAGSVLLTDSAIAFHNLTVKSMPVGCEIEVDFTDVASQTPVLSSLAPDTAVIGDPPLPVSVTGSNFKPGSIVSFNGADLATTFVSDTELGVTINPVMAYPGAFPVIVKNTLYSSDPVDFTFTEPVTAPPEETRHA